MKKILVTGAAGFIGFHLTKRLINDGYEVIGLDSINSYYDPKLKLDRLKQLGVMDPKGNEFSVGENGYKFIKLDLTDLEALTKVFTEEKPEIVINLAAQAGVRYSLENPRTYIDSNITGFFNILDLSQKNNVEHLLFASSSSVYGLNEKVPFSEHDNTDHPTSLYAASKKANEVLAHSYSHIHNLPITGLRFFTVYGPWGRPDMALFKFTKSILAGEALDIYGHGDMYRDFTYIDDIIEGIVRLISKVPAKNAKWNAQDLDPAGSSAPYKIFNIGRGSPVKLIDFVKMIEKELKKEAKYNFLEMQPGEVYKTYADTTELKKAIDYKPEVNLEEGVKNFIEWYLAYYKN